MAGAGCGEGRVVQIPGLCLWTRVRWGVPILLDASPSTSTWWNWGAIRTAIFRSQVLGASRDHQAVRVAWKFTEGTGTSILTGHIASGAPEVPPLGPVQRPGQGQHGLGLLPPDCLGTPRARPGSGLHDVALTCPFCPP